MHPNEQKQQFSFAYVRAVASAAGFAVSRPEVDDDSVDLQIGKRGLHGTVRSPRLDVQVKCTEKSRGRPPDISFQLPLKNYEDLRHSDHQVPRILVVMFVPTRVETWLSQTEARLSRAHCGYWVSGRGWLAAVSRTGDAPQTVPVKIPRLQVFSVEQLSAIFSRIAQGGYP